MGLRRGSIIKGLPGSYFDIRTIYLYDVEKSLRKYGNFSCYLAESASDVLGGTIQALHCRAWVLDLNIRGPQYSFLIHKVLVLDSMEKATDQRSQLMGV